MDTVDPKFIEQTINTIGRDESKLIPILQAIQQHYRYLPQPALQQICDLTEITPARLDGVASFYPQFRRQPVGKYVINVCHGTACHVKGAELVHDAFRRHLKLSDDTDTDDQKLFTLQKIACLGCCTLAPAVQIEDVTYGHLTPDSVGQILNDFLKLQQTHRPRKTPPPSTDASPRGEIRIGLGSCCVSRGSGRLHQALQETLRQIGVNVHLKQVGCVGICHQTPLLEIIVNEQSHLYARVQPEDAKSILLRHFRPAGLRKRISSTISTALDDLIIAADEHPVERYSIDVRDEPVSAFLDRQMHLAIEHCGSISPLDIDEYLSHGGFQAAQRCLNELSPETVIDNIRTSQLRGRGGAGFATGLKWATVKQNASDKKYVICNGDEGDPGAFMDRMLLESYPYRIIEGIIIAAYAVGADEGYFYIRAEYPLAVKRIRSALESCTQRHLLGDNILDSGFSFHLHIMEGASAFVCGEESALLASLQGQRAMPRLRPPYPAQQGLWGKPTLVNNVETFALVPWILNQSPQAFANLGSDTSKGTKVFALAGKIERAGLIEVPMGITISQIVQDIGGGIPRGKAFKAVQIGGPSGACIPRQLSHVPVDYEALSQVGGIMGSGGLVVLDETDCMVDIARYFLQFTQNQSCGKCTFCRIGTKRMLEILDNICIGAADQADLERLEDLSHLVKNASLCGLGKTAPNPVISTLRYFRPEYEAHLAGRCPAAKCRALITYSITDDCIGCTLCAQHCPVNAIAMTPYQEHEIDPETCIRCGSCKNLCPVEAVTVQ